MSKDDLHSSNPAIQHSAIADALQNLPAQDRRSVETMVSGAEAMFAQGMSDESVLEVLSRGSASKQLGYVYVIHDTDHPGRYKIGITTNLKQRMSMYNTHRSGVVALDVAALTSRYAEIEAELHQLYSAQRVHGEWFDLTPADIEDISLYLYDLREEPQP